MPLTPWDSASLFLSVYPATGLVAGKQAQSLLLVGDPSSGKSELLRRFRHLPSVLVAGDVTVDPLRDLMTRERPIPLRHLIMPEFGRLFSHNDHTVAMATNLLTALMTGDAGEELVGPEGKGHRLDLSEKQIGIMAAMPTDTFKHRHKALISTGFLSRFVVLGIRRSRDERERILKNIVNRRMEDLRPFRCVLPQEPVEVRRAEKYGNRLLHWVREWAPNPSERFVAHVMTLLPAISLLRGRTVVQEEDFALLKMFQPYLNSISLEGAMKISECPSLPTYAEFRRRSLRRRGK